MVRDRAGTPGHPIDVRVPCERLLARLIGQDVAGGLLGLRLQALEHHRERRRPQVGIAAGRDEQALGRHEAGVLRAPQGEELIADGVAGASDVHAGPLRRGG